MWRSRPCGAGTHPRSAGGFAGHCGAPGRDGRRSEDRGPAGPRGGKDGTDEMTTVRGDAIQSMVLD